MADDLNLPEGVNIPTWFRRFLEARANVAGPANPPPQPPRETAFSKICKDFKAMGGKDFLGTETFVEARNWLKETEDLFVIFEVEDNRKVQLAAWLMKEEASYWWEVTNAARPLETWADFRGRFGLKFLSSAEESLQMERFLALKQGNMTVKEYVNRFNQLARFGLELVNTPQKKALRFARGLNEPLHGLAMTHVPMGATFESLVDMALLYEEDKKGKKEVKPNDSKNKKVDSEKGGKNNNSRDKRKCNYCGTEGHIANDCRKRKRKQGECFHCGKTGHISKDCPEKQTGPSGGTSLTYSRCFVLSYFSPRSYLENHS